MDKLFIIVKNVHGNPKLPVRYGIMGNGLHGFCLYNGLLYGYKPINRKEIEVAK